MKVTNRRIIETVSAIAQITLKKSPKGVLALMHNQRILKPIVEQSINPAIIALRDEVFGKSATANDGQNREFSKKYKSLEDEKIDVSPYMFPFSHLNFEEHNDDMKPEHLEAISWLISDIEATKESVVDAPATAKRGK